MLLVFLTGIGVEAVAQIHLKRADSFYAEESYEEAIRNYRKHLRKSDDFIAHLRLARSYQVVGDLAESVEEYNRVVIDSASLPSHKFELARVLKAQGEYKMARAWFLTYAQESADPSLGEEWAASCTEAMKMKRDSLGYRIIEQPAINTRFSEMAPVTYKAGVVFSSNRQRGFLFRFLTGRGKGAFYDLYYANKTNGNQRLQKPIYLRQNLNTRFHDGPAVFTPSEHIAFVTRSNMGDIGGRRDAAGYNRVNIYRLENKTDRWQKATPMPFNSSEYNVAHPAISNDGQTLYFSSDMPGGYGETDIWMSRLENDKWTRPVNLGPEVNSAAHEGYPFLVSDSVLYFSSDRAEGFGGKDIFHARRIADTWTAVRNAGYPLNSEADDFGYSIERGSKFGYFVSNREGSKGNDDIYGFRRYQAVEAQVVDSRSGNPMQGVTVQIQDVNSNTHFYSTDEEGRFVHYMRTGKQIRLETEKKDYHPYKAQISTTKVPEDANKYVLIPLEELRRFLLQGTLTEAEGGNPISDAIVQVIGPDERRESTNDEGFYDHELDKNNEYTVIYVKEGYIPKIFDVSTEGVEEAKKYLVDAEMRKGPFVLLEGIVTDKEKGLIIPQANIHIVEANTQQELQAFQSRKDGKFWKTLDHEGNFSIIATQPNFLTARYDILRDSSLGDTLVAKLQLIPLEPGKVVKVIYYDYDRSNIRVMGMRDLNEIAYLLMDNPEISVELSAHTDSRGSQGYNAKLSQHRADATVDYLVSRGIDGGRIRAKGYGEKVLANDCGDGKDCPESAHQLNRRTEVKVVRIDRLEKKAKDERNEVEVIENEAVEQQEYEKGHFQYKEEIQYR